LLSKFVGFQNETAERIPFGGFVWGLSDYAVKAIARQLGYLLGQLRMHLLHRNHAQAVHVLHALNSRFRAEDGRERGDTCQQSRGTDSA
jgi:hypothetical protein